MAPAATVSRAAGGLGEGCRRRKLIIEGGGVVREGQPDLFSFIQLALRPPRGPNSRQV